MKSKIKIFLTIIPLVIATSTFLNYWSARAQTTVTTGSRTPPPTPKPSATPATEEDNEVIRVESKLVVVPVSVSDSKGELVKNLRAGDFLLRENGKKQEIEALSDPEQMPLDIALLIDVSGSVDKRFAFEKEAAERFLRRVFQKSDQITVFKIDSEPVLLQSRTNLDTATGKLRSIVPTRSATAFYDTIVEAAQYLKKETNPGRRRVIVAISDGEDTFSEKYRSVAASVAELQKADTLFYSINPGGASIKLNQMSRRGQDAMAQMASSTGGAAFLPETDVDLDAAFGQIALELRSQYLLQYYSNNDLGKGGFIPIQVEVDKRPDLRIRARQGYYLQP